METKPLENQITTTEKSDRFETDSQRIVRRHLENEDDVITDEDLRSVRIGQETPVKSADEINEDLEKQIDESNEGYMESNTDVDSQDNPTTPWDLVNR